MLEVSQIAKYISSTHDVSYGYFFFIPLTLFLLSNKIYTLKVRSQVRTFYIVNTATIIVYKVHRLGLERGDNIR